TIGSRRRAAASASPSRVCAFSRTSSSSRAACQVARSTMGGLPGLSLLVLLGVVVMVSSAVSSRTLAGSLRALLPHYDRLSMPSLIDPSASMLCRCGAPVGRPARHCLDGRTWADAKRDVESLNAGGGWRQAGAMALRPTSSREHAEAQM